MFRFGGSSPDKAFCASGSSKKMQSSAKFKPHFLSFFVAEQVRQTDTS